MTGTYAIGDLTITARENFFGLFILEDAFPGQKFGSKFTTDLEVSYKIADHYTLAVGATNLFNTYPDKIKATAANPIYVL
ncbi:TonB-dependent receptor, partial [Escherichia coli]|nr:TonB-dependent receptor [Escherichia coli]